MSLVVIRSSTGMTNVTQLLSKASWPKAGVLGAHAKQLILATEGEDRPQPATGLQALAVNTPGPDARFKLLGGGTPSNPHEAAVLHPQPRPPLDRLVARAHACIVVGWEIGEGSWTPAHPYTQACFKFIVIQSYHVHSSSDPPFEI